MQRIPTETIIKNLSKEGTKILSDFREELKDLKPGERIMYYCGETPTYATDRIVRAKLNAVEDAYDRGQILPLQRRIGSRQAVNHEYGIFEYYAYGAEKKVSFNG